MPLLLKFHKIRNGHKADDILVVLLEVFEEPRRLKVIDVQRHLVSLGADEYAVF